MLGLGLKDATVQNVAQELVPGLVKRAGVVLFSMLGFLFSHAQYSWVRQLLYSV